MGAPLLGKHFAELQSASTPAVAVAAAGSFAGQVLAVVQAAPLWVYVVAAIAPWLPILALELIWTYRHYRWLAVFCLLLVTQTAYLLEQIARMIQVHLLGQEGQGIFGALDLQRVQLVWITWAIFGLALLASRFPRNAFLWLTLLVASVDGGAAYLSLLVQPAGAFPVGAPELRFGASALAIVFLNLAFAQQLGRTYDAWLARAFPQLPEQQLIETTGRLEEVRLRPGERVEYQATERLYIVTGGSGVLLREGPGGHEILLRVLSPGEVVRDSGTVQAETTLELLAVPEALQ
jgi:hypothetical protein